VGASPPEGLVKNRLREARTARGWSQGELADRVDASRQTINAIEADKYDPSLPLAYRLAALFGLPVERIFLNPFSTDDAPAD
jgi:putative transcriptional regulator